MSEFSSREELEHLVVIRHKQGWSGRKLAKTLGISRNTVRKILKKISRQREKGHDAVVNKPRVMRPSKLDPHRVGLIVEQCHPGIAVRELREGEPIARVSANGLPKQLDRLLQGSVAGVDGSTIEDLVCAEVVFIRACVRRETLTQQRSFLRAERQAQLRGDTLYHAILNP